MISTQEVKNSTTNVLPGLFNIGIQQLQVSLQSSNYS